MAVLGAEPLGKPCVRTHGSVDPLAGAVVSSATSNPRPLRHFFNSLSGVATGFLSMVLPSHLSDFLSFFPLPAMTSYPFLSQPRLPFCCLSVLPAQ